MTWWVTGLRAGWLLTAILSVTAGAVDAIGFLALGGLFTAHITGNLVLVAAALVRGGPVNVAQALAIPVFMFAVAAASLIGAFNAAKTKLTAANSGLTLTYNFAGSNALVTQITQGAPADVFASADTKNMQKLVDANLVDTGKAVEETA